MKFLYGIAITFVIIVGALIWGQYHYAVKNPDARFEIGQMFCKTVYGSSLKSYSTKPFLNFDDREYYLFNCANGVTIEIIMRKNLSASLN